MIAFCVVCGRSMDVTKRGRPRETCSNACRQHLYRNADQARAYRNVTLRHDMFIDPAAAWSTLHKPDWKERIEDYADQTSSRIQGTLQKPVALDLFCGAGGVSMGLYLAGFHVVGVDISPRMEWSYPFEFHCADALHPHVDLSAFDLICASPPCQQYSVCRNFTKREYPDLIAPVRELLRSSGKPYIIENVPGAPLRNFVTLSGPMFGLRVIRRRNFESNLPLVAPIPPAARGSVRYGDFVTVAGGSGKEKGTAAEWREAMGIDWMTAAELAQAIPPAYSWFLGVQAREALR